MCKVYLHVKGAFAPGCMTKYISYFGPLQNGPKLENKITPININTNCLTGSSSSSSRSSCSTSSSSSSSSSSKSCIHFLIGAYIIGYWHNYF